MPIASSKDIADAFSLGRSHTQRFLKNAGSAGDGQWQDWSYSSGQPAYDARIGDALTRTPVIASRNDAIFFPDVQAGQHRHLSELRLYATAGGAGQLSVEAELYDLIAVYPLIDGDNTDPQAMDNAAALPRYADGSGVRAILVNHIAPAVVAGCAVSIDYTDAAGASRSVGAYSALFGTGKASFALNAAGTSAGGLYLPTEGPGVRSIDAVTFASAPGGLWAIYLVRPIQSVNWRGGLAGATQTVFSEKNLCAQSAFVLPRIYDGAHLGFFYMPNGSARTVALYGSASFIWG